MYIFMCICIHIQETYTYRHVYICIYFCICVIYWKLQFIQTVSVNYKVNFGFYSLHICNSSLIERATVLVVLHAPPSLTVPRLTVTNTCLITAGTSCGAAPQALVTLHRWWLVGLFIHNLWTCRHFSLVTPLHLTQALSLLLGCKGWGCCPRPTEGYRCYKAQVPYFKHS
jgi:hypothetical protein